MRSAGTRSASVRRSSSEPTTQAWAAGSQRRSHSVSTRSSSWARIHSPGARASRRASRARRTPDSRQPTTTGTGSAAASGASSAPSRWTTSGVEPAIACTAAARRAATASPGAPVSDCRQRFTGTRTVEATSEAAQADCAGVSPRRSGVMSVI